MSYKLPPNVPVHALVKFADVLHGDFGAQVKLKAEIDGTIEHVYLPGSATDTIAQLLEAGVVTAMPDTFPAPGDRRGVPLALGHRDVVLTLRKPDPRARAQLIVERNGRPPAPVAAPASTPIATVPPRAPSLAEALNALTRAGAALAEATCREMELADERALVKDAAIRRLVETGQERSATAAEKFVERDAEYAAHRRKQYEAVVARITAQAAYEVAWCSARALAGADHGAA